MKHILCHVLALSAVTALAVPSITEVSMLHRGKDANSYIQIDYRLNDEPAVVTVSCVLRDERSEDRGGSLSGSS